MFHHRSRNNAGFSLIEALTAVSLVLIACSAMLLSVGQAIDASQSCLETSRASMLAEDLMREISACRAKDPSEPTHWGPESDETASNTRSAFDDIDDYDGWSSVAQTRSGESFASLQQRYFPQVRSQCYSDYVISVKVTPVTSTGQPSPGSPYRMVEVRVEHPAFPPQEMSRIFYDAELLLGKAHWYDPNVVEPPAPVVVSPLSTWMLP